MLGGHWRLLFGLAWAGAAAVLFARGDQQAVVAWAALLLAIWNAVRWYQTGQRPRAVRPPLQRQAPAGGYEYNPELDFQKMDREADSSTK